MRGVSEIVPTARSFSGIVQIAQSLPLGFVRLLNPILAAFVDFELVGSSRRLCQASTIAANIFFQLVRSQVSEIFVKYNASRESFKKSVDSSNGYSTVFHEILNSSLPEHEKTIDRMTQEALSIISAASETTTSVLATTIFHVLKNPNIHGRLAEELNTAARQSDDWHMWKNLEQLPYLVSESPPAPLFEYTVTSMFVDTYADR